MDLIVNRISDDLTDKAASLTHF